MIPLVTASEAGKAQTLNPHWPFIWLMGTCGVEVLTDMGIHDVKEDMWKHTPKKVKVLYLNILKT